MRRFICTLAACFALVPSGASRAQGNIDWEELWVLPQPSSTTGPYGWMAGQRTYTGLAYDRWHDVLYVVNPGMCTVGASTSYCPKIHILDAMTGVYANTIGRAASGIIGLTAGQGGQLALPLDTIVTGVGWGGYGGWSQGQFPVYKIDLDDEGRIYAGNLVSPIWGICFPGPPPNCDPIYLGQGPYRLYRWDTPWSTPRRIYATLNMAQDSLGGPNYTPAALSEMSWTRWGDALDVVGQRTADTAHVDSVRIYVSGGPFTGQTSTNPEIAVILTDTRTAPRVGDGLGRLLEKRLGARLISPIAGLASSGIAATGPSALDSLWVDSNTDSTRLIAQAGAAAYPGSSSGIRLRALSDDPLTGTGQSGPIAHVPTQRCNGPWLIVADGYPSNTGNPSAPNTATQARVMSVNIRGQEYRQPSMGNTPFLGIGSLTPNGGANTYIADVDYKFIPPSDSFPDGQFVVFVLMSNNGIGAYRARHPCGIPVTLVGFRALAGGDDVLLSWEVASERNNLGFGVERSFSGGRAWEPVGFVAGRGSDPTPASYDYRDPLTATHRSTGSAMYRLRQVNSDGSAEYSPSVTVYLHAARGGIALAQNHPNPVSATGDGAATIGYQLPAPGFVTLRVYNALGEAVAATLAEQREAGSWQARVDVSRLPAGSYVYELDVDGATLRKTMIVVK